MPNPRKPNILDYMDSESNLYNGREYDDDCDEFDRAMDEKGDRKREEDEDDGVDSYFYPPSN